MRSGFNWTGKEKNKFIKNKNIYNLMNFKFFYSFYNNLILVIFLY